MAIGFHFAKIHRLASRVEDSEPSPPEAIYQPSKRALLRTAPLSALVASSA